MTYIVLKAPLNSNQPTNHLGYENYEAQGVSAFVRLPVNWDDGKLCQRREQIAVMITARLQAAMIGDGLKISERTHKRLWKLLSRLSN